MIFESLINSGDLDRVSYSVFKDILKKEDLNIKAHILSKRYRILSIDSRDISNENTYKLKNAMFVSTIYPKNSNKQKQGLFRGLDMLIRKYTMFFYLRNEGRTVLDKDLISFVDSFFSMENHYLSADYCAYHFEKHNLKDRINLANNCFYLLKGDINDIVSFLVKIYEK